MDENITRWRLILGQDANALGEVSLNEQQSLMDATLAALYDDTENNGNGGGKRSAGLGNSAPNLAKWLTDVRSFFPPDVVSVIQTDAIERKGLTKLLFEPETLKNVKPDISMVGTLMALKDQIPAKSKDTARELVKEVVNEIMKRMEQDLSTKKHIPPSPISHQPTGNEPSSATSKTTIPPPSVSSPKNSISLSAPKNKKTGR